MRLCPLTGEDLDGVQDMRGPGDVVARGLEENVVGGVAIKDAEEVVIGAGHDLRVVAAPRCLELVEDAVVLVEIAQLGSQIPFLLKKKNKEKKTPREKKTKKKKKEKK